MRLTDKISLKHLQNIRENYKDFVFSSEQLMYEKLGQLEDLEEKLGCPLDIINKALKKGIYIKNIYDEMTNFKCRLTYKNEELGWYFNIINGYVMVKDYKKTWWLKEDKSE